MNQDHNITPEISIAPMMDWTDRHCRYFHRLISPNALLYTEMVTTGAILNGDYQRFLRFNEAEHPVALQLGGYDPVDLAKCARLGEEFGYDEINLNCGCPSDRVQSGRFGACLMREPALVADGIKAMQDAVNIPVTVKCRIGVDDQDEFADLDKFVETIADNKNGGGCETFIIHARKAWLKGLSPKENRDIPPLMYDRVKAVKEKYPHLRIILNGGLKDVATVQEHIQALDGAMIGREAYQNPYILAEIEQKVFGNQDIKSREQIAQAMTIYAEKQAKEYATPTKSITRHMVGLFHHQPGAKAWKRALSTLPHEDGADHGVILKALEAQKAAAASFHAAA